MKHCHAVQSLHLQAPTGTTMCGYAEQKQGIKLAAGEIADGGIIASQQCCRPQEAA